MKYYNIVEIIGAGTGSDSHIGMYSGDLRFISSENLSYPNHYTGFIDNKTISDVLSACNISQGGALGGFQGIVSVNALSADLCNSIVSGGITLIGKTIKIKVVVNHDSTEFEYQRYTGVITSWSVIDEVTVSIASDTSAAFDKKKVSGISVTKEMALNDPTNEAIGKNVTNVFGGKNVDYPAIYVSTENIPIALSMQTQSGMDLIAHKLGSYTGPKKDYCTDSGLIKGATLFGVFKKYQASEKDNVKICLSFNGKELFNVGALYYEINSMLSGMRIKIVSGSGKGEILKIVSVNRETNDSYNSIWIELSTNDIDLLTEIGGYTSSINKSIKTGEPLILGNGFYNTASTQSDHFNASYDAGTVLDSVSYFSIIGQPNIFIIHGSIDVKNGAKLVGSSQDSKTEFVADIPYDAIKTVYASSEWNMLQIDTSGLIVDEDSSFMFMKIATNKCLIHNVGSTVKTCHVGVNNVYTTSDYYENDAPTDGEEIGADFANGYTTSYSIDDIGTYRALFNTTLFVPIEDLFNGLDLSNGNSNFGIVPKFYHEFRTTRDTLSGGLWKFYTAFNIYVVGEGNSVLSQPLRLGKIIKEYIFANSSNPSPLVQNIFRVTCEPENSRFVISENHNGTSPTTTYDYDSFNSLCSQLDLSGDLNALSSKQIRGVLVQIRSWIVGATDGGIKCNTNIVNTDLLKHIYGVYTFSSSKVSKEKIYIRAQRNNNGITVDCPASIVKRIATESGLTCDAASFGNVESTQRALYSDLANSSAQYQTSSDESISDAVDSICKHSMMAVYQKPDGKFYASWFPDDSQEIDTNWDIPDSLIVKGSVSISKPNSAYLSTDFNFSIKQKQLLDATSAFVNTDSSLASFPESGYRETHGTIYTNGSNGYTFTTSLTNENVVALYITKDLGYIDLLRKFPVGTFWKITFALVASPHTELDASGVITAVAFSTSHKICVGFSGVTQAPNDDYIVKSIQLYAPNEKWLDYVSGSFISEYSIAKNIWDHAQNARLKIGVEKKMNSQLTKLEQPIWGDDSQAIINWMLYSVIYNTREKTVIRFSMPMISTVMQLSLMDAVKFQFGVYSSTGLFTNGIKGRIVEINDDYENAKVDFTMLCSVSDSDSLIIDERVADGSLLIDENNVSNNFYDEGALA